MTLAENLSEIIGGGQILENEPMKNHTTFRIGGPADVLVCPETEDGFIRGLGWCRRQKIPVYIIGNGSNLLVGDKGFRGVVFKICRNLDKTDIIEEDSVVRVHAGAGAMLAKLAKDVSAEGCGGFEFATGIPGTLGGAVAMNAGAYGGEMKDILKSVRAVDMEGNIREFSLEELELGYRTSRIQKEDWIVLSAEMVFEKGDAGAIMARVDELSRQRREKQPLEYPSAGSTFKRPEGYFAGKLISDAGLKGFSVGGAQVSEKHAGFVINTGNATAADVIALTDAVRDKVFEKYGVKLELEIKQLG